MQVLVAGGNGFIGAALTHELSERGHDVTVLSRSPDLDAPPQDVETVSADVRDADAVGAAVEGHDAVVNLVALSPLYQPSGGLDHESVHYGGTRNLHEAAEDHDVDRFVQLSALGASSDGPTEYIRQKGRAEQLVREGSLDWVVFRPSVVFGDGGEFVSFTKQLTTPYVTGLPGGGQTRFQPIHRDDFVPMIADAVEDDGHVGEAYEIGGPEVLTLAEVTELAYEADGSPVTILPVPMALAEVGLTAAGPVPLVPFGPDQARALEMENVIDGHNDIAAFGVESDDLVTLSAYLGLD